ncbi:hemolysin family protein [Desulfopila aestuarii]|uniref:Hemolysin, contains CBS domains n=1 Tax=Desulfopila aestuarii DSM 18488 TaxID=1121416 RepID=A0A1M7Y4A9_9BACT|nr:hemolysin family protein [Desulfopila aestuarii]SHO46967.1 Hemolysin, contains CBS domains [Desulfopila aestuarii DSM 18488]
MLNTFITAVTMAICVSAVCSLCEAVLYSLTASQVEMLKRSGFRSAQHLQNLRSDIEEPITAILTLNTIANTIGASVAGAAAAKLFGDHNVIWFSALFTLTILIFSEILPKTLGVNFAYRLAPFIAYPLKWMVTILKPIVWVCRTIIKLLPSRTGDDNISSEELQTIAALSRESGQIEEEEERVIANILQLKDKMVRHAMTPRTVTFSLEDKQSVADSMKKIDRLSAHSRIPTFDSEPDNVTGIVLRKDILQAAAEGNLDTPVSTFVKPAHFVPETAPLNRVLLDFFDRQQHLFVVVDEYGSMTGIISMEDVIEEIVGREIIDESDKNQDMREFARSRNLASLRHLKNIKNQ